MTEKIEPGIGVRNTVGEMGESEVLARVLSQLSPATAAVVGPGDDCAVVRVNGDLVVTSDTMIEGTDFRLDWHTGYELGWKLAATNLSDVAAMGASPTSLTVSFACPRNTPVVLLEDIAAGLDAACAKLAAGCAVVGGDLATAPAFFAAVTALGQMEGRAPVLRSGARPGDVLAYAGELGLSGLGLSLLHHASAGDALDEEARKRLRAAHPGAISAHLTPAPPVVLGSLAQRAGATAMLDVSDALSLDAHRIATASRVRIDLHTDALRRGFGVQRGEDVSLEHMLSGGEDHGLLATFPPEADLPEGFAHIGAVYASEDARLTRDGAPLTPQGWDTFTGL